VLALEAQALEGNLAGDEVFNIHRRYPGAGKST
jgi:hypothetical protein